LHRERAGHHKVSVVVWREPAKRGLKSDFSRLSINGSYISVTSVNAPRRSGSSYRIPVARRLLVAAMRFPNASRFLTATRTPALI